MKCDIRLQGTDYGEILVSCLGHGVERTLVDSLSPISLEELNEAIKKHEDEENK